MIFRVRYKRSGGHIHCRLFAAKALNTTYAKCGDFCVRVEEFESLRLAMSGVSFLKDEEVEKEAENAPD